MPGAAIDIGVGGNGKVWVIGTNKEGGGYGIYRWDGKWTKIAGSAVRISVGPKGNAWVVNKQRKIYRFNGSKWIKMPGAAIDIGIGARGHVAVVGTNKVGDGFGVWRWTGKTWNSTPGGLTNLAVGPRGKIWGVNSSKNIFVQSGSKNVAIPNKPNPKPSASLACLKTKPTSGLVTYGGKIKPVKIKIEKIMLVCIRFNYGGGAMWTKASAAGGISCVGKNVQIDYGKANSAFNGIKLRKFTPAACGPKKAPPKSAPVPKGSKINIYYGKTVDMASVPLRKTSAKCIEISYGGNKMWFPKSAYKYRSNFVGNPPGLNYSARRSTPCR